MGNIVGSREISSVENDVILGSILGDGCLEKNGKNVRLKITHSAKQKEYLFWKYDLLKNISTKPRYSKGSYHKKTNKFYGRWGFSTKTLPDLLNYYNKFYIQGRKSIPNDMSNLEFSKLAFAIWYMDDGCKRTDCNAFRISTDSFNYNEQLILKDLILERLSITSKIHRKAKTWNLYIPNKHANDFIEHIYPFVIDSMKYKISLTP